jgi:hypothetical protein
MLVDSAWSLTIRTLRRHDYLFIYFQVLYLTPLPVSRLYRADDKMINESVVVGGMGTGRRIRITRSATLSTTNPTSSDLGSNLGRFGEKPESKRGITQTQFFF